MIGFELVSIVFSCTIAYFSARSFRMVKESHLLALPAGFAFLAASQFLMAYWLIFAGSGVGGIAVRWLQLFAESYAYALIAFAYFAEKRVLYSKYEGVVAWGAPLLIVIAAATALALLSPAAVTLPSFEIVDEYFTTMNLLFLLYIAARATRSFIRHPKFDRVLFPAGMGLLALSQYNMLISAVEPNTTSIYLSYFTRLMGLILLVLMPLQVFLGTRVWKDESPL